MNHHQNIIDKLRDAFALAHLDVINESANHNVAPGSQTHFKVVMVSEEFATMSRLSRHRRVHDVLSAELGSGVHALAVHPYTVAEWRERFGEAPMSPDCRGGKAAEERS